MEDLTVSKVLNTSLGGVYRRAHPVGDFDAAGLSGGGAAGDEAGHTAAGPGTEAQRTAAKNHPHRRQGRAVPADGHHHRRSAGHQHHVADGADVGGDIGR